MTATPAREPHPQRCRKLFVNSDHVLSCIAPFADDITNEKCIEGKGECEFREVPATHTSPPAAEPDVKAKIVEIMTVAAHCKDRTYGEVADEIITLLSRQHTPVAETHFIIDAKLRADIVETLRKAGCPCLASQVLEKTMPDYQIKSARERMQPYLEELASPSVSDARKREILESLREQGGLAEMRI